MKGVLLEKMAQSLKLAYLTPEVSLEGKKVCISDINRPALQLAGYLEHFANERVQIVGYVDLSGADVRGGTEFYL